MEREKKDLSFILILLSTLIGTAVLFQWAIPVSLRYPDRRPRFSLSGWQSERRKQEMGLHQYDTGYGIHAGCRIQPVISVV